jgi:putative acetyltransferase
VFLFGAGVNEEIVGFASVTPTGYLDFMFVHHAHQGKGIAKLLLQQIEQTAQHLKIDELTTHASITAKPFFEKEGFEVVKQQTVNVRSVDLINFVMQKKV